MVLHEGLLKLGALVKLDPEGADQIQGPVSGDGACLLLRLIIGPEILVDAAQRRIGQGAVQEHMDKPDALQSLMEGFRGMHRHLAADAGDLQQLGAPCLALFLFCQFFGKGCIAGWNRACGLQAVAGGAQEVDALLVGRVDLLQLPVNVGDDAQVALREDLGIVRQMVAPDGFAVQRDFREVGRLFVGLVFREGVAEADGGHGRRADDQLPVVNFNRHLFADLLKGQRLPHGHGERLDALPIQDRQVVSPPLFLLKKALKQLFLQHCQTCRQWLTHGCSSRS